MSSHNQWSGGASDTGNVLAGTPLGALLSSNAGFSIDYERVPQAIADLEHAAAFFRNRAVVAQRLANIPAPGIDGVSLNTVAQIGKWASAMARRPCELLTPQQASGFGFDVPPKVFDAALGDLGCEWTTTTSDRRIVRTVHVTTFTNNPTLEVAYSKDKVLPFFELTEIAGYPAIVTRTNANLPSCDIDVKAAERQSVTVIYDSKEFSKNPQQSCEVAKQVAAAVVTNLPPKG